jgi:hypothetical protein
MAKKLPEMQDLRKTPYKATWTKGRQKDSRVLFTSDGFLFRFKKK